MKALLKALAKLFGTEPPRPGPAVKLELLWHPFPRYRVTIIRGKWLDVHEITLTESTTYRQWYTVSPN